MKINLVLSIDSISGGALVAFNYLEYLHKQGHDVVCYIPKTGFHHGWRRIACFKSLFLWYMDNSWRDKFNEYSFKFRFPLFINNTSIRNADITIATAWITSYWVKRLRKNKGRTVYFIQDYETWGDEKENMLVKKSYKLDYDLRITVSTQLHDKILNTHNSDSIVICNGIPDEFIRTEKRRFDGNVTIGVPYRERRGSGIDLKNSNSCLLVLKRMHETFPQIKLKAYGFNKPEDFPEYIEFFENPSRDEIRDFYDNTMIFYAPSIYEGWGLPAMEAMARGCAVIASNTGCIKEFGSDDYNVSIIQEPTNIQYVFDKIVNLSSDKDKIQSLSQNAISTIRKFAFSKSANNFEHELLRINEKSVDNI